MINFYFDHIDTLEIQPEISSWLENIIIKEGKKIGKIDYIFCDDDQLLQVNKDFLQHDYYTDIITFDYVKGKTISGDIFVSLPRISDNASSLFKNFEEEFKRVLAHGILHLCGYKDKTEAEQKEMRNKEDFYLNIF